MNRALPTDARVPMSVNDCGNGNSLTFLLGEILKHLWSNFLQQLVEWEDAGTRQHTMQHSWEPGTHWSPDMSVAEASVTRKMGPDFNTNSWDYFNSSPIFWASTGPNCASDPLLYRFGYARCCQPWSHQWALTNKLRYRPSRAGIISDSSVASFFMACIRRKMADQRNIFCSLVASSW